MNPFFLFVCIGDTEHADQSREWLRQVNVPISNKNTCQNYDTGTTITDRMICAGYKYNNTGFTDGDAGGPLICEAFIYIYSHRIIMR